MTMEPSKVYFTDFHTVAFGDGLPAKLKKLIKKAGIEQLDMDGKFVAIKSISENWETSAIFVRITQKRWQTL